jgi:glycine betaine/proline transport system ATP-binding protein
VSVEFQKVDVVFGSSPKRALEWLERGESRDTIHEKTGQLVAVHGASLHVGQGELCVLMGLSGSGKSSLLRCANGLNRVTRGRVLVRHGSQEVDVASCGPEALRTLRRECISMVFQQFALLPWRTVLENVAFGLEVRGLSKQERLRVAREQLALVGLEKWEKHHPHQLSGGMQQRVGLARAFATGADVLLMDEPFSALDPLLRRHLQDELLELQRRLRKTILFVSHDIDEALKLGTKIAILDQGRLLQVGTPEDIVLRPADSHVARFVEDMNPLPILRCSALLTPVEALERAPGEPGWVLLEETGRYQVRLDAEGRVREARVNGVKAMLVRHGEPVALEAEGVRPLAMGRPELSMQAAVAHCQGPGAPLPVVTEDGRMLGVVGARELLRGLLHRPTSPGAASPTREPQYGQATSPSST